MKKIFSLSLAVLLIVVTLSSCNSKRTNQDYDKIKIGVIETTGYKKRSYIHFYDENLNFLYKEETNHASLSEPFDRAIYKDGYIYAIPRGLFGLREEKCILKYKIHTDEYEEYDTGLMGMLCLTASDEYLFGAHGMNGVAAIARVKIDDPNDIVKTSFPDFMIGEMKAVDDQLYAVISRGIGMKTEAYLCVLSAKDLKLLEKYDISELGSFDRFAEHDGKIYISNQYTDVILATPASTITVFDKATKQFTQIDTKTHYPLDMFFWENLLFVSHYDKVQNIGNTVSIINLENNTIESHTFDHAVEQMLSDSKYIYILDQEKVFKYQYSGGKFEQLSSATVDMDKSGTFFYISGFFMCD